MALERHYLRAVGANPPLDAERELVQSTIAMRPSEYYRQALLSLAYRNIKRDPAELATASTHTLRSLLRQFVDQAADSV